MTIRAERIASAESAIGACLQVAESKRMLLAPPPQSLSQLLCCKPCSTVARKAMEKAILCYIVASATSKASYTTIYYCLIAPPSATTWLQILLFDRLRPI